MKLSVLITYHNEGAWLSECLQSVLRQPGIDEVLIYDDASRIPAAEYVLHDERVRCLRGEENIGPARARNALLAAASGTHVHFHDADDLFAAGWSAAVRAAVERTNADIVFTDVEGFDEAGHRWSHVVGIERLLNGGDLLRFTLLNGVLPAAGTYARAALEAIGGYREDLWQSEDYDLHIRLALSGATWVVINEDLALIRRHGTQRSRASRDVWTCAVQALSSLADRFPAHARAEAAQAATRAGSQLLAAGAPAEAAEAFALANQLGGARYERAAMQGLARLVGAPRAERLAGLYRRLTPKAVRKALQRSGF